MTIHRTSAALGRRPRGVHLADRPAQGRVALAMLMAAGLLLGAPHAARAQVLAPALVQRLGLAAPQAPALLYAYDWPARAGDRLGPAGIPVFARIGEFLRVARGETYAWGSATVPGAGTGAEPAGAMSAARDTDALGSGMARGPSLAEQRPDLQDGDTGQSVVMRFITYRLPWLVTPESAIHALPTLTMGGAAAHFDVMAGAIGGRSGAYGEFVVHF